MDRNSVLFAFIIALVVLGGAFFVIKNQNGLSASNSVATITPVTFPSVFSSPNTTGKEKQNGHNVTISFTGFSPKEVTISTGESVTWINNDTNDHQVNSDTHPTHLLYPSLNTVGLLHSGDSKSLSFPVSGSYGFHDHLNPQFKGTVIVK